MNMIYPACFYPFDDGRGYTVNFPDLPGCVTEGRSFSEAIELAADAAAGWILSSLEDGEAIPKATDYKDVRLESEDGIVNMVVFDIDSYSDKYSNKSVRTNVSIPAWLKTAAEANHINFSKVLQEALISKVQK
ncbi:MAG: hypothetical protein K0Q87_5173 [Neobacillus sp.]|jgi:predicted RNase H-like HicB family nuclease|nr:hypothetical protein [Neobacillus sp.]